MSLPKDPKKVALCVCYSWFTSQGVDVQFPEEGAEYDLLIAGRRTRFISRPDKLVQVKVVRPDNLLGNEAWCPRCGKRSSDIAADFGTRNMEKDKLKPPRIIIQAQCRKCRAEYNNKSHQVYFKRNRMPDLIHCDITKFISLDPKVTIKELNRIAPHLGLGRPGKLRIDSKKMVKRMLTADYDGVAIRGTQFQRTWDIPTDIIKKYWPIIQRESNLAGVRYRKLLSRLSLDVEDMTTIGLVYFHSHFCRHAEWTANGMNKKLLVHYLRQSFKRWYDVTWKKLRNVDFSGTGLPINEFVGSPIGFDSLTEAAKYKTWVDKNGKTQETREELFKGGKQVSSQEEAKGIIMQKMRDHDAESFTKNTMGEATYSFDQADLLSDIEFIREDETIDPQGALSLLEKAEDVDDAFKGNYEVNQDRAKAALDKRLSVMDHDEMVGILDRTQKSDFIDPAARREAKKRLSKHRETCSSCPHEEQLSK